MARANILRLLEICIPSPAVWSKRGWDGKPVEDILADIAEKGMDDNRER